MTYSYQLNCKNYYFFIKVLPKNTLKKNTFLNIKKVQIKK